MSISEDSDTKNKNIRIILIFYLISLVLYYIIKLQLNLYVVKLKYFLNLFFYLIHVVTNNYCVL